MTKDKLTIDFLYLDLTTCRRCQATDVVFDEALNELREELKKVKELTINKTRITSDKEAKKRRVLRSPTIRLNGVDIEKLLVGKTDVTDNYCADCKGICGKSCSEVTGGGGKCRTFEYRGKSYNSPPKEMIKEAIRRELSK
ncbi:MAG: DUF2703 domain-containing protein [Candidatus Micrarchaeota archaeon]